VTTTGGVKNETAFKAGRGFLDIFQEFPTANSLDIAAPVLGRSNVTTRGGVKNETAFKAGKGFLDIFQEFRTANSLDIAAPGTGALR